MIGIYTDIVSELEDQPVPPFRVIAATAALVVGSSAAHAAELALDLLDAPVSYKANFTVSSDKGTYQGQVWHTPGKERREYATSGGSQALIVRRDTNAAYMLKPSSKWYVGLSLSAVGALAGGLDSWQVDRSREAEETVAGLKATRYKVHATGPKGRFDGNAWFSKEGILVKAAGTVFDGKTENEVETSLSNVKLAPVAADQFEPPAGWMAIDLKRLPADQVQSAIEGMRALYDRKGASQ
jgi:hypothetical protein